LSVLSRNHKLPGCPAHSLILYFVIHWYTNYYQVLSSKFWLTIFISPQKVLLALSVSGPLRAESALSLVFTVVLVTDVLLQLDHVSGTTYLPGCETSKSAAQNSEDN